MNLRDILTDREVDVAACLLNGRSVKRTALLLGISPKTVETYLRNLMLKLQCNSRDQLTDTIAEANLLQVFHQHYAIVLGQDLQPRSKTVNVVSKNSGSLIFLLFCITSFVALGIIFLMNIEKKITSHVRDSFLLPHSSNFLKRSDLLKEISKKIIQDEGIQIVTLVGIGGSGKTTLARSYAVQYDQGLAWEIAANTRENILLSFEKLVLAMLHQDKDINGLDTLQKAQGTPQYETILLLSVKEKLSQRPNWLLIFDNVCSFKDLQSYLPNDSKIWGRGKIIITTTDTTFNNIEPNRVIKVVELTELEKMTLFNKIFPFKHINTTIIKSFLAKIPPFPLDVSTAAHYLKTTTISHQEYLEKMLSNEQFNQLQESILNDLGNYTKTRYSIVCLSIKSLVKGHKDFEDLLLFLSLIDSQNIPRKLLEYYKDSVVVDNFLYSLQKHSLLQDNNVLNLHKTTQEIMLSYFTQLLGVYNQRQKIDVMAKSMCRYVDKLIADQDLQVLQQLLPHLLIFLKHEKFLSKVAKADLNVKVASIDIKRQLNQQSSRKLLRESLLIYESYYPSAHPKVAWVLGQLGILSKFNCQRQKYLFEESLKKYQQYYGQENSFEYCWVWVYFGNFYRRIGQYAKAEDLLLKSLKVYEDYYGPQHIQTAWVLANLGRFYRHVGDQKKSKDLLERCLKIQENHPNGNIIEQAWVTINLGIVYHNIGDLKQAKMLIDKGIKIYTNHYNAYDYEMCWALIHKAFVDAAISGDWLSAKETISQNIDVFIQEWGEGNIATAWALERLLRVHINLEDYSKAQRLLQQILTIYHNELGENSVKVAFCKNYLGYIYFLLGNYKIAEHLFKSSVGVLQGIGHPRSYTVLENLVSNYKAQGQHGVWSLMNYEDLLIKTAKKYLPHDSPFISKLFIQEHLKT